MSEQKKKWAYPARIIQTGEAQPEGYAVSEIHPVMALHVDQ